MNEAGVQFLHPTIHRVAVLDSIRGIFFDKTDKLLKTNDKKNRVIL